MAAHPVDGINFCSGGKSLAFTGFARFKVRIRSEAFVGVFDMTRPAVMTRAAML